MCDSDFKFDDCITVDEIKKLAKGRDTSVRGECYVPGCTNPQHNVGKDKHGISRYRYVCLEHHKAKYPKIGYFLVHNKQCNMEIVRLLMNGPDTDKLLSNISNNQVEDITITMLGKDDKQVDNFQLHHMRVKDGKSYHKNKGKDPSKRLVESRFHDKPNIIMEIMGCVAVTPSEHKLIHAFGDSDITNYIITERPWCLQTKRNYDYVKDMYNLPMEHEEFLETLKNDG